MGSGMGVLTKYPLGREDIALYAAEIDPESVAYLRGHHPDLVPRLIEGDFLEFNLAGMFPAGVKMIGKFPYNISSQVVFTLLYSRNLVSEVAGMIPREVAVRITDPPGSRLYSDLSVLGLALSDLESSFPLN